MMKKLILIAILLSTTLLHNMTTANDEPYTLAEGDTKDQESIQPKEDEFVRVEGTHFILKGKRFRFVGSNTYYLGLYLTSREIVDRILEDNSRMGVRVIRTWAFGDGENYLQTAPGVYREEIFQNLDYLLAKADKLGGHLKTLLTFGNNWKDYGGIDQYVNWSDTASDHNDFYTDDNCKKWFKNHISTILNRKNTINGRVYRLDPTIFAWQLANELRAPGDRSGDLIQAWIEEMSTYIKTIDPNHLVATGLEGFYRERNSNDWKRDGSQGTDFVRNHNVKAIDFAVFHLWPEHWQMSLEESIEWVEEHIEKAHSVINKPVILEEFGEKRNEDLSTRTRDEFYKAVLNKIYHANAGGALFWAFYHDGYPDYDRYGVYTKDSSTTEIISNFAKKMTAD
jgi:mannan endo-1,4-beta-mannosidase